MDSDGAERSFAKEVDPLKRHPSLEAFSRDHNVGLVLGRRLDQAAALGKESRYEAVRTLLQYWHDELEDHFAEEERLLSPLIPSAEFKRRLAAEHDEISQLIARLATGDVEPELVARTGNLLYDHIRWEERALFPAIERSATPLALRDLAEQAARLEARRSDSTWSPRRAELMKRRANMAASVEQQEWLYRVAIQRWETEGGTPIQNEATPF